MRRLSTYLFRVAGLSALVAAGVTYVLNLTGFAWMDRRMLARLTPELRAEYLANAETISPALSMALQNEYSQRAYDVLLAGSLLGGAIAGGLIGLIHARRLLRPIDAVAQAAQLLATGDTSARAHSKPAGIREIDAFQANFNSMAAAIQRGERNLRESNAAIAHELRTPLTILNGRINGMIDGVFPTDPEGMEALLVQTAQLQRLIEDLNLLTLAEAGRFVLRTEAVDLADLARRALEGEGDITLSLKPAPAEADPDRVRQILAALVLNARRYAGGVLTVETDTEDGQAVLRVLDRGPGLPPEAAIHAFDRFWRAEMSRSRAGGGSGLGLSVVRALAETHGGTVAYTDREGGGAAFVVRLPAAKRIGRDND